MKKLSFFLMAMLFSMVSFAGTVTFDADSDAGNAGTDSNNATAYTITKDGVTVEVSSGIIGAYNGENHYRIYKNQTVTVKSTAGNIASIEFTCTANGDAKYGPGCLTTSTGSYSHDGGAVGTWAGSAASVTFTASANQVRATQIVVTVGEGGETPDPTPDPEEPEEPVVPEVPENLGAKTIAEFLELKNTTDTCVLTGVVANIANTTYGNFDLVDATGSVYVYGLLTAAGESKQFASMDIAAGDALTVKAIYNEYNGNPQVKNAIYVSHTKNATPEPEPDPTPDPEEPETPVLPEGEDVTFLASADKGNATDDYNKADEFTVTKNNVSMTVTKGIVTDHYRIYKNETLTITSAEGNIVAVQLTCTAEGEEKYGPGCLTANEGTYTYAGTIGTWIGNASSVVFTASSNQVRATQIVVILAGGTTTGLDNITIDTNITKTIVNGQLIIIKDGVKYNAQGAVVK